jgi:hypothetical protein
VLIRHGHIGEAAGRGGGARYHEGRLTSVSAR